MELLELLLRRRSVREYRTEEIPSEHLKKILQAGLLAPSSRNRQPCHFYVVRSREMLQKLSHAKQAGTQMLADCNAAITVSGDSEVADTWVEDCSIALSYMQLMATEIGVGSCWCQLHLRSSAGGEDAEQVVRDLLALPSHARVVGILALGFPKKEPLPHTREELHWDKVHWD